MKRECKVTGKRFVRTAAMLMSVLWLAGAGMAMIVPADEVFDEAELEDFTEMIIEEEQNLVGETNADPVTDLSDEADIQIPADDSGLIEDEGPAMTEFVTEQYTEAPADDENGEVTVNGLRYAKDYREVYEALSKARNWYYPYNDVIDYAVEESASAKEDTVGVAAVGSSQAAADSGMVAGTDYSLTNLRDSLVDEADIVKTDGNYLYILKDRSELVIVSAAKENAAVISMTELEDPKDDSSAISGEAMDMYVDGTSLVIVSQKYDSSRTSNNGWYSSQYVYTQADTYDISEPSAPVPAGSVWQEGYYKQSRKVGDYIYLYSWEYPDLQDSYEESSIIPVVNDMQVDARNVCIPNYVNNATYLIVSAFSQNEPYRVTDTKVLVSGADQLYVSSGSLYAMNMDYSSGTTRTEIVKFSYLDGQITGKAAARVRGEINNSFSLDEYNGYLRVLTTYTGSETGSFMQALGDLFGFDYYDPDQWTRHNALYILDENLRFRSKLGGIAAGEEIKSARYFGDTAYFVTFRNTDPLFTADLSDPEAPKLTGELKVSGFSSYLHPYTEGYLLGIGYEADEETGQTRGLKLSLFDVTDPSNVTEVSRYVMDGITWCPAIEDYKSIYVEPAQNLIGFYVEDRYMLFSFDAGAGFERVLLYDFYEDMLTGKASYDTMRAVRVTDEMYLAGSGFVVGFTMDGSGGFNKNLVLEM